MEKTVLKTEGTQVCTSARLYVYKPKTVNYVVFLSPCSQSFLQLQICTPGGSEHQKNVIMKQPRHNQALVSVAA